MAPPTLPLMSACQSRIRHGPTSTPDFPLLAGMEISAGMGGASCREHAGPCQPAPTSDRANTHYTFGFVETVSPPISLATNLDRVSLQCIVELLGGLARIGLEVVVASQYS